MFEYNFGDSEFLMLFLVLITLPYAADRRAAAAARPSRGTPPPPDMRRSARSSIASPAEPSWSSAI